ncbi:MAG: phage holin family protein [Verrucomicrobiota bacterium]
MSKGFLPFLQRWVVTTLAVLVAAQVVKGIHYDTTATVLVASLLLGFLNAFVRPILLLLSLPLLLVSLGLFIVVINALLLRFVGEVVKGFTVADFWTAVWGSIVISLVSTIMNLLLGCGPKIEVRRGGRPPRNKGPSDGGGGPVIDV